MPKGKSAKPMPGDKIRVREAVSMPEFPDLPIAGWTGRVLETTGAGSKMKVILEWDEGALAHMPESYRQHCESQGLVSNMACLPAADLELDA